MSELYETPFKKPECTDMHNLGGLAVSALIRDVLGGLINFQVVGTDPDYPNPIDGATMADDYVPAEGHVNPDGTFFIVPETSDAQYAVVLADGTQFLITPTQTNAYLGQWYPARLLRVLKLGTTGDFSVGY